MMPRTQMDKMEVTIAASDGDRSTPAFAMLPQGAKTGVVIVHELFGRQPEIDRVVERFARSGVAAIAPDFFANGRAACIRAIVECAKTGADVEPVRRAKAARAWLCDKTGLTHDRIGLIGFCFGGGFVLAAGRGWGAVSTNYGSVPEAEVMRGIGPVMGCYGRRDRLFANKGAELTDKLAKVGVKPVIEVVPQAGHSFLTDGHHPIASAITWPLMRIAYDATIAEDAWKKILAFFDHHLARSGLNQP